MTYNKLLKNLRCIYQSPKSKVSDNIFVPFPTKYDSKDVEKNKYQKWINDGYFSPKENVDKIFSLILPPPNITGTLHLGHALTITLQDIICRWKRMQGYSVVWVPGTDHAGIGTQVMVEKLLQGHAGQTRHDVGKNKFLQLVDDWKEQKSEKINKQLMELGASVDWSRYFFTMDKKQSDAITEAVIQLFDSGLLYRQESLVNWSSYLQSTISDYEIENVVFDKAKKIHIPGYNELVEFGRIYSFCYKVANSDEEIEIATTRPETVFGDVAVAINPKDHRYIHLHGKTLFHPLRQIQIPIIVDDFVDPKFGSGAVKITPGHSQIDFNIAKKHNLPMLTIFTESGYLNNECGQYTNLHKFSAKNKVIEILSHMGLLRNIDDHYMELPVCSRTGDVIEKMLKQQWFIKCDNLVKQAINAEKIGAFTIEPENYSKIYHNWLNNHQDWCISRQIWWGHKLPLYKVEEGWIAAKNLQEAKLKANKKFGKECKILNQDEDVLDTWFSSSLLPFSAFGWPEKGKDYLKYYPLSLMETGSDILNFWVVRMILLGLHFTGKIPFQKVLLHGMICDGRGQKMSKSKGNVIEFDNIINGITLKQLNEAMTNNFKAGLLSKTELQYAIKFQKELFPHGISACGADALRLTLSSLNSQESYIHFNPTFCKENTIFCNKMWQGSKFIIGWCLHLKISSAAEPNPQFPWQHWLLHRLSRTVNEVNDSLEKTHFDTAVKSLKSFFHYDLCDVYLEIAKPYLKDGNRREAVSTCVTSMYCLETYLRLMFPIMPFICDELYSYLPWRNQHSFYPAWFVKKPSVWQKSYPTSNEYDIWKNENIDYEMCVVKEIVTCARALFQLLKLKKNDCEIVVVSSSTHFLQSYCKEMQTMIRCKFVSFSDIQCLETLGFISAYRDLAKIYAFPMEKPCKVKMMDNMKLLQQQFSHSQKEISDRLIKIPIITNEQLQEVISKWKNLESNTEHFFLKYIDGNELQMEQLVDAAELVSQCYRMKNQLYKIIQKSK